MALYDNEDDFDLEFSDSDTENLEENENVEGNVDEDEKHFDISDNSSDIQKQNLLKKIGIGVAVGAGALVIIPTAIRSLGGPKKPNQTNIEKVASDGEKTDVKGLQLTSDNVVLEDESKGLNVGVEGNNLPCNVDDPNDPNNQNNPNCNIPQNQMVQQGQKMPEQTVSQAPTNNNSTQNNEPRETEPVREPSREPNVEQQRNEPQVVQVQPQPRKVLIEKAMPVPPAQYQPQTIAKPNTSYASLGGGNQNRNQNNGNGNTNGNVENGNTGNTGNSNMTTNGTSGQSQSEADKINGGQNRIRPTNLVKKADNVNTFLLSSGTFLPLVISTNINSDNPSYFMAIVSQNVYSKNGQQKLLIPMGSKVIGNYKALANNTDTRMFMFVEKIILPTEEIIAFSNENVVDLNGEIGTRGKLNSRFWQRLGSTVLALSFTAADYYFQAEGLNAAQSVANSNNGNNVSASTWDNIFSGGTSNIKDIFETIGSAWSKPKNRIKVKVGTRLNVLVMNDLVLPEYKGR